MRAIHKFVVLLMLPLLLLSTPAIAQQARVVDEAAMSQALAAKANSEQAQRAVVLRMLDRDDAREVAAQMGLSAEQAATAVATLSGAELDTLAQQAARANDPALAGGARQTIVISTVTLLLLVIILLLLVD